LSILYDLPTAEAGGFLQAQGRNHSHPADRPEQCLLLHSNWPLYFHLTAKGCRNFALFFNTIIINAKKIPLPIATILGNFSTAKKKKGSC
jgi:hypothetical protein